MAAHIWKNFITVALRNFKFHSMDFTFMNAHFSIVPAGNGVWFVTTEKLGSIASINDAGEVFAC